MSQLCDGVQCRLTARTGGSTKGEILASELEKKQTDQVKRIKSSPQQPVCLVPQPCYLMSNNNSFPGKPAGPRR